MSGSISKNEQSPGTHEICLPELILVIDREWRYAEPFGRFAYFFSPNSQKRSVKNQGQGNWSHASSASRKIKRRHFLCETHFYRKGNNWMGNSNGIYFPSIALTLVVENPRVSLFKSAITRKGELKWRFKKWKRVFEAKFSNSKTYTSRNKRKSWNLGSKNHI